MRQLQAQRWSRQGKKAPTPHYLCWRNQENCNAEIIADEICTHASSFLLNKKITLLTKKKRRCLIFSGGQVEAKPIKKQIILQVCCWTAKYVRLQLDCCRTVAQKTHLTSGTRNWSKWCRCQRATFQRPGRMPIAMPGGSSFGHFFAREWPILFPTGHTQP